MASIVFLIARVLLGALFLWAGVSKIYDPIGFSMDIRNYELIGDPWNAIAALFLPWLEIIAGTCLMAGLWIPGSAALIFGSLIVFTGAIVISWARGLDIACGCFGFSDDSPTNYPLKIAENVLLLGLAGWTWWRGSKHATGAEVWFRRRVPAD